MQPTTEAFTTPRPTRAPTDAVMATPVAPRWSSERAFIGAAALALVGLASPWELSALAAAHGGGAFLLVYLAAIVMIALPLLQAELVIGRRTRRGPTDALAALAMREGRNPAWQVPGWIATAAALALLAVQGAVGGRLIAQVAGMAGAGIPDFPSEAARLTGQLAFLAVAALVAGAGLRRIEQAGRWGVAVLAAAVAGLFLCALLYDGLATGAAAALRPDFGELGVTGALLALRQACFTLGLGTTVMAAYGARLSESACIPRSSSGTAAVVVGLSLMAGLAAAPFMTGGGTPRADAAVIPFVLLGLLLLIAAQAAAVALLEPAIATIKQRLRTSRRRAAAGAAAAAALLGAAPAIVAVVEMFAAAVLVPVAAAGIALFAGHVISRRVAREELAFCGGRYRFWWMMVRWAAPAAVLIAAAR